MPSSEWRHPHAMGLHARARAWSDRPRASVHTVHADVPPPAPPPLLQGSPRATTGSGYDGEARPVSPPHGGGCGQTTVPSHRRRWPCGHPRNGAGCSSNRAARCGSANKTQPRGATARGVLCSLTRGARRDEMGSRCLALVDDQVQQGK